MNNSSMETMILRGIDKDLPMMDAYIDATHPNLAEKRMPLADYLTNWNEAKERGELFKLFGGKNIISKEISFTKSLEELRGNYQIKHKLNSYTEFVINEILGIANYFLEDVFNLSFDDIRKVRRYYGDHTCSIFSRNLSEDDLKYFINRGCEVLKFFRDNPDLHDFFDIISILYCTIRHFDTWFYNEMNFTTLDGEKNPSMRIPGYDKKFSLTFSQKPIRALNNFIRYIRNCVTTISNERMIKENYFEYINDLERDVENLRLYVSMMMNQNTLKGTLSLSIHPFDYMTMSEPENGWTSCMRWDADDPGEYHAGTLEMLTSPCVIVAYLKSKDTINPAGINYEWNKKKWRELFIVDKQFISGIKGYPYNNNDLENHVFSMLNELAEKNWGVSYKIDAPIEDNQCLFRIGKSYFRFNTSYMYNDRLYNPARVVVAKNADISFERSLNCTVECEPYYYGENCFCLCCGKPRDKSDSNESEDILSCSDCSNFKFCSHCGVRISENEAIILEDGSILCETCDENRCSCDICESTVFEDDVIIVKIKYEDPTFDELYPWMNGCHNSYIRLRLCNRCYEEYCSKNMILRSSTITKIDEKLLEQCYIEKPALRNGYVKLIGEWIGEGEKPACFK